MKSSRLETSINQSGLMLPENGHIAVLRAHPDQDYAVLPLDRTRFFNSFRPHFDRLSTMGYNVTDTPAGEPNMVLVNITRSKAESLGLIAQAMEMISGNGLVVVDGEKTDGIESILKQCKSAFDVSGIVSKSHGKIFWMQRPKVLPAISSEWRDALAPSLNNAGYQTAPGMFSPEHVDKGSALLVELFDGKLKGRVADLGAGWGWLASRALKQEAVSQIDLYEAEDTALTAAKANISDDRAAFFWQDVTQMQPEAPYDAVICNPPFHLSRAADPSLGLDFIRKSAEILKPNGTLWLVANRQLPYEAELDAGFKHWKYLDQGAGFKVIQATKPVSAKARQKRLYTQQNR